MGYEGFVEGLGKMESREMVVMTWGAEKGGTYNEFWVGGIGGRSRKKMTYKLKKIYTYINFFFF